MVGGSDFIGYPGTANPLRPARSSEALRYMFMLVYVVYLIILVLVLVLMLIRINSSMILLSVGQVRWSPPASADLIALCLPGRMHTYVYIYIYMHMHVYIYIYVRSHFGSRLWNYS